MTTFHIDNMFTISILSLNRFVLFLFVRYSILKKYMTIILRIDTNIEKIVFYIHKINLK